jgi:phage tail sheath protein FI
MAVLVSPGVSVSVIDQSINVGAGPGTVPLIFVATQQDKADPTSTGVIAPGTIKANAGKVWSITSQRDLVSTFGNPVFYSVSGTSLNGYPLNEYGLLAAYSYLGASNLCRVVRADVDTAQLEPTPVQPISPAAAGTYWLDESSTGSSYGLFKRAGTFPNEAWVSVAPSFIYNFATGTANPPTPSDGINGDYAIVYQTASAKISYWTKVGGAWVQIGTTVGTQMLIQSVWPDLTDVGTTEAYWLKTTSAAQGANIVLRKMSAAVTAFLQVEAPILANDSAANTYYNTNANGSLGQVYIEPVIGTASTLTNELEFRLSSSAAGTWSPLTVVVGSRSVLTQGPTNGQLWFNSLLGLNSAGASTIDIMVSDGSDHWDNIHLPGFSTLPGTTGNPTLYPQPADPRDNIPAPTLLSGDIWVATGTTPYPVINRWNGTSWVLVSNDDQTTPYGIIFQDARPGPNYKLGGTVGTGANNGGGNNPDLDADAPQAALYPKGFLLWNTRYSSNNVKEWQSPYVFDGVTASPDNTNNSSVGRWVNKSGNNPGGVPYMGAEAQRIVVVQAIQASIQSDEDIRAEDLYFNLIAAPGFVEAIDEMLVLNEDRKETAFVVGDTPFTLAANGTELQNWATDQASAFDNGADGLVSASKYFAAWYPSGLSTNVDGTDVVVPPSHMALRTIAYNDQVAYPWFAPAGLQRGIVNNASAVGYVNSAGQFVSVKLNEGQRDILYQNGINPIRVMPQGGIVVYGQKTRQPYASATDRINVVRLENYLRYQLNDLAQPFLFQPNDTTTRKSVLAAFNSFLSELITLRGLYDFLVVCDKSNNTPARIDRNELWVDIAVQPVKAIEFIYIPIRIKNTGSSLSI